jgi:hypothetical protein
LPAWWDKLRKGQSAEALPSLNVEPSLYDLIKTEAERTPDKPIDESVFPRIGSFGDGLSFASGSLDALAGRFVDDHSEDSATQVKKLFVEIGRGKIQNWKTLEQRIGGHGALANLDRVLEALKGTDVSRLNLKLFRDLAQNSRIYEAVKWGIGIGALDANPEFVEALFLFARHSEFTVHAVGALFRSYPQTPQLKERLLSLLPVNREWGVIRLVELILGVPDFASDLSVQRECLICGMQNNESIPMEIAFTLASHTDVYHFLALSQTDRRVFMNFSLMMNTLLTDSAPLGGLRDLPEPERLFSGYLALLEKEAPDNYVLMGLKAADEFLNDSETQWLDKEQLLRQVRDLLHERASLDILSAGLKDPSTRWIALRIIRENRVRALVPDVETLFLHKPDSMNIEVLSELGGKDELERMFLKIPEIVNLSERAVRPLSKINLIGPEHKNSFEYAGIVKILGQLGTPEATLHLKRAFRDYDPLIRAAACAAVTKMDRSKIDLEIANLIEERLEDSPKYVVESARQAASWAGLSLPGSASNKPN